MIDEALLNRFLVQFDSLKVVVEESAARVISDPPDFLFYDNQNVFIKSYLVSACSILEAFIQDLVGASVTVLQKRMNALNIPYNFVNWLADNEKAKLKFAVFEGNKTIKDVSDMISPNFYKTKIAFERIGLDVVSNGVASYKDFISSTVEKRNKIVHHNDSASDLSFSDITATIDAFMVYSKYLYSAVCANSHLVA